VELNRTNGKTTLLLLCILILLVAGFRIVRITADPPANFGWSGGYFADEGYWSHNARNQALFGNPVQDEWDARVMSPVFAGIQAWMFRLFGVGLAQVRMIGVISSILLALASFFVFRKQFAPQHSFLLALLVSLNYPMMILGRQGILDPFAAALAWTALLLLLNGSGPAAFVAGALFVVSCTTKYLMVYAFVPLAFVPIAYFTGSRKPVLLCVTGAATALAVWLLLDYLPNRQLIQTYGAYYSSQQNWGLIQVVKNIVTQPFYLYFLKSPVVLFFGNLMLWFLVSRLRSVGIVEKVCWVWLVTGIVFFSLWKYRPERYYTSLLPPLAGLAGMALLRIQDVADSFRSPRSRALILIGIALPSIQCLFFLADAWSGWDMIPQQAGIQASDAALFLMLTGVMVWLWKRPNPKWVVVAFLIAFAAGDLRSYLRWVMDPPYQAVEIAKDLQRRVGTGVVAGQWAPEVCLENKVRVVPVWHGFVNSDHPIQKYGITHLLLWRYPLGDEAEKFSEWYPEEFRLFHPVTEYTIKDSKLVLYEVNESPGN
jgi:4-amino-4-deoxy-L-arabinose transferase-like glycosyltransferase